ncbi:T3SS (YopN, CesT) and YbjN peptide-binding chaperone 1 [Rhodococcus coprophilus]|uniref:TY-Chap central domain-containing protein n=1 Tax=Rhodococcus coprophilus TaxID=38310 RepID=A0A2X4UKV0_9NOCA|nr:hypothetical protein [Rhodococcus coprophilus]MBM7460345.1 hypothetical protein [Rhodococcus coprophilus]SQI39311.1 Uncharacterised protein [Rhodococcus coprophilus]
MTGVTGTGEEQWDLAIPTADDAALRDLVVRTLAHAMDGAPEPDEDGDVPIWIDDVPTFASVDAEAGVVHLTTFLAEGITDRARALEALAEMQFEFPEFTFVLHKDRVTAEQRVGASPLVPLHLLRAVGAVVPLTAEVRGLAARLGGEACVFDGPADTVVGENLLGGECGCGDCTCG